MAAHLSHVVGNVQVHVHADYELHQMLRESDILVNDGEMEGPAQDRREHCKTHTIPPFQEVTYTKLHTRIHCIYNHHFQYCYTQWPSFEINVTHFLKMVAFGEFHLCKCCNLTN